MTRVFSGVKPTGHLTLGNYLGAMRQWATVDQHQAESLFCIVDLHALTVDHDPARVRRLSRQAATLLLAVGLDPGQGEGCPGAGAGRECAAVAADVSRADGGGHPGVRGRRGAGR